MEQQPEPQREVVYVKQASNGLATAAMVLGIVGAVIGLIPLFSIFALALGILAVVFGFIGRKKAKQEPNVGGGKKAIWGIALGFVAIILAFVGFAIIDDAVTDLERDLDQLEQELNG